MAPTQSRLRTFTPKATPITYENVNVPKSVTDFFSVFKANSGTTYKTSNEYQICVFPDLTPLLCAIIKDAKEIRSDIVNVGNPKVSPYSYVAYCLALVYAFFLIHDKEINPDTSYYADQVCEHQSVLKFLDTIQDFPVPDVIAHFFTRMQPTCLETHNNQWFCPSLNGFSHHHHFGRSFPINLFTNLHDMIAEIDARATPGLATFEYYLSDIMTINNFQSHPLAYPIHPNNAAIPPSNITYRPANYFASMYPADESNQASATSAPSFFRSKLHQVLNTIFSPSNVRKYKAECSYAEIGLAPSEFNVGSYNPYDSLLVLGISSGRSNIHEIQTFMQSVASVLVEKKICTKNFASYFNLGGSDIIRHGYSNMPIPHFDAYSYVNSANFNDNRYYTTANAYPTPKGIYDTDFARMIKFKESVSTNTANLVVRDNHIGLISTRFDLEPVDIRNALTRAEVTVSFTALNNYLVRAPVSTQAATMAYGQTHDIRINPAQSPVPTAADFDRARVQLNDFKSYNSDQDEFPLVKMVDHLKSNVDIHLSALCGLLIYGDELAATIVPHVNTTTGSNHDNNQFLQSSIPMSICHQATCFQSRDPIPSRVTRRAEITAATQPALTMIRVPNVVYDNTVSRYSYDFGYQRQNYGLTSVTSQAAPIFNQTVIGHNVSTVMPRRRNAAVDEPASTPYGHLVCWSAYTFVDPTLVRRDNADYSADIVKSVRFLTNLRSILGTQAVVFECESPLFSIPI